MSRTLKGRVVASLLTGSLGVFAIAAAAAPAGAQSPLNLEARGGLAVPVGDLSDVGDPGAGFGAGLAWRVHDRIALRADGDLEILSQDLAGGVVMPVTYLWHLHGGLELNLTDPATAPFIVRLRGGAGATIYDTERFAEGEDDFLDTFFSAGGGLAIGRRFRQSMEVGVIGQAFVTYAEKERTSELSDRSPTVLHAFREASSFPVQIYLRWAPR